MDAVLVAVGWAGGRLVHRRDLEACRVSRKILIGAPRFQGRGGAKPHRIMEASAAVVDAIWEACRESVSIVAGLGGGTSMGIAPLVARIA